MSVPPVIKVTALGAAVAITLLMQINRADAQSNIFTWLDGAGLHLPVLRPPMTDNWIGGGGLLVLAGLVFWLTFGSKRKPFEQAVEPIATPAVAPLTNQFPDLPIRDLFLLLTPGLTERSDSKPEAERVARAIQQQLASGALHAWGKPEANARMLYEINAAFWQDADWTYWFLPADPRNRDLVHAASANGQVQYRDLHVSRAAVTAVFGK